MLHSLRPLAIAFALFGLVASSVPAPSHAFGFGRPEQPLEVVSPFEVERYLGRWYEIASFPQSFQKGCLGTTAEYALVSPSKVSVTNRCYDESFDGDVRVAHGTARIPNPEEPSKLLVSFFWPFSGKYWVIELGNDYEYAVVGHPNRDYLWVLSRSPFMDEALYDQILDRQAAKGFDVTRLVKTPQREHSEDYWQEQ